jgi:multiple sugar transport system substrate-binding protein
MPHLTRRDFHRGLLGASALTLLKTPAFAQTGPAEVTKKLPKTFAGSTVRILFGTGTTWDILAQAGKEFTEATGIKLDFTMGQYMDRYTKMVLDLTTGTNSYDIYPVAYQWKYDVATYLADLSKIDSEVEGAPALDLDDYASRPLEIYGKVDNRLIALPVLGDVTFVLWNKNLFEKARLDPDKAPSSWDEIVQNGKKITGDKRYGFGMPAGKNIQTASIWMQQFNSRGGKYFDDKGYPQFNSDAGLAALEFMVEQLQPLSPPGSLSWDISETVNSFATETSAQMQAWPSGIGILADPAKSAAAGHFGWAVPPQGSLLGGHGLGLNAKAKNMQPAKLFLAWLTSKEIVMRTTLAGGAPVRMSAFTDPELVKRYPHFPMVAKGLQGPVFSFVPLKEAEQVHRIIFDEANAALAKTKPVKLAMSDMQQQVADFVKRRGYLR